MTGNALILDPFERGTRIDLARLQLMVKATLGADAELQPEHYAAMTNRGVLLRLQNNIKSRVRDSGNHQHAAQVLEGMLAIAPEIPDLWREAAGSGADAPGPAVRHGLYHRDPYAGAYPARDAGGERPGRGAQRAGKTVRHPFPRSDAADADHQRPEAIRWNSAPKHKDIIVKPLFGNGGAGVFHVKPDDENLGALLEMHFALLYASR
jgi:hypothetical protein